MYRLSSIVHGIYWHVADARTAFESAVNTSHTLGAIVVENGANKRTCVVYDGRVSVYVKDGQEDYSKWK